MVATSTDYKISIEIVKKALEIGRQKGLPVDQLMEKHNLSMTPLENDPAYMSGREVERILAIGLPLIPDPFPGLEMGLTAQQHMFGLAAYLVQTASTVGDCARKVIEFEPLFGNSGESSLEYFPGEMHLVWKTRFENPYVRSQVANFVLLTFSGLVNAGAKKGELVREVHLAHDAPQEKELLDIYHRAFNCQVCFGKKDYRIIFPVEVLEFTVNTADPLLNKVLEEHARKLLDDRGRTQSFADKVRLNIGSLLHKGCVSREKVAELMNTTSRTLHRKLREEGTSYSDVLASVRLELSCELLRQTRKPVQVIARDVGFDEAHSFTRWFRQMTRQSPSEYRQSKAALF